MNGCMRCHLYSKSFEEIIEAESKHREKVFDKRQDSDIIWEWQVKQGVWREKWDPTDNFGRKGRTENATEVLEIKCKDLEDEIVTKDIRISKFEDYALPMKNTEETIESELKLIGNALKSYAAKVKDLDGDLIRIKDI